MTEHITFRHLGPADLALLLSVPEGLFDGPIDPVQAEAFLNDPGHVIVLAFAGDLAVGLASGTVLLHPDKPPAMFVNEIGVRDDWLRRGIGKALSEELFGISRASGCKGIWLATEPDNLAARALYRRLGGEEMACVGYGWDGAFDL